MNIRSGGGFHPIIYLFVSGGCEDDEVCQRLSGNVTEKRGLELLDDGKGNKDSAGKPIKLPADVYERYFTGVKPADVAGIVEEALAAWFRKGSVLFSINTGLPIHIIKMGGQGAWGVGKEYYGA